MNVDLKVFINSSSPSKKQTNAKQKQPCTVEGAGCAAAGSPALDHGSPPHPVLSLSVLSLRAFGQDGGLSEGHLGQCCFLGGSQAGAVSL